MQALFYIGRGLQLLGMFMLLEDLLTDMGRGPNPNLFYMGIGAFVIGWGVARIAKR